MKTNNLRMVACLVILTGGILIGSGATLLIIERFGGVDETYRLYRVLGEVVNQDGEPISNARAELWNSSSAITAVCTGQNGEFQLYSYLKVGDIVNLVIDRPRTRMESNVTITAADDDVIYLGKITVEILPAFPYKDALEPYERPRILDADALAKLYANWDNNYTYQVAHNVEEATELIENGFEYVTEADGLQLFRKRK